MHMPEHGCSTTRAAWSPSPAVCAAEEEWREAIFFEDGDQEIYRDLLAEQTRKAGVTVWAWCLLPNHVHLFLTPQTADGLGRAVGETHRRYTNFINARGHPPPMGVAREARGARCAWRIVGTGHLFQRRSSPWRWTRITWWPACAM